VLPKPITLAITLLQLKRAFLLLRFCEDLTIANVQPSFLQVVVVYGYEPMHEGCLWFCIFVKLQTMSFFECVIGLVNIEITNFIHRPNF